MIITTTEKIPNKEIVEILGIARGSTVRARNIGRDIFAGLKDNASLINALPGLSKELSLNQAQRALETLKTK